jgi:hypothetical protein
MLSSALSFPERQTPAALLFRGQGIHLPGPSLTFVFSAGEYKRALGIASLCITRKSS